MTAALALAERGRGRTAPNPNVGCVIVRDGRVVGRGWTQPAGRPHAEAMALAAAGDAAHSATCYVTLEPCAHASPRGPACADSLIAAGVARVVVGVRDPDPRTDGLGADRLRDAGIEVVMDMAERAAWRSMAGFMTRRALGRPFVSLKLAMSLDGAVALANGSSQWITGPEARAHAHVERARHEAILVGRGTWQADAPTLNVRVAGLEARSPRRILLSGSVGPQDEWERLVTPGDIAALADVDHLLVEGGVRTAAAFLAADLVDRLLIYRAPILVGGGLTLPEIGLCDLADAHGLWRLYDSRVLGSDQLQVYERDGRQSATDLREPE
ncbi:MAG: bifunctional diaminohydroxyphosphoribosylaminopyrimidine deaminase/5-amino-6-(5-phosphoribosylamino)uracil reductase RibD [Pseudomonadota bacterium]|uniref:bifunctional diaminohydroxyphosphoribosylaminopyrimidine deaminase/5-amino-6-(5-phosphoribosylamino)uracil reductase RibD n=1 Tax=Sphingomonas sp. ERG5 TaxID=1381597 RepID=UPI00054B29F2|nr:bifunctional diaminohydroxyphosphoribosylaminopyrimidine deaminase/5-amino-6-(5-phosphoribosylamino)uracil reductase RibD [Sphingomonas sp. ERG5]